MKAKKYIVGGAVRDTLLSKTSSHVLIPHDIDYVVVGATYDEMCEKYGQTIGKDFPVWLDDNENEVALARKERSIGNGTNDFTVETDGVTLKDDLGRRDLTINALAIPVEKGFIFSSKNAIDYYGGVTDLKNKVLRHTTIAFKEDPLRVLRLARFYARFKPQGFTIAEETVNLCKDMIQDGMLEHLPKERIWAETVKALKEHDSSVYFKFLSDIGFGFKVTTSELWSLRNHNLGSFMDISDYVMLKWSRFDINNRFVDVYGVPKTVQKASSIARSIKDVNPLDAYSVYNMFKSNGAYQTGDLFEYVLINTRDTFKRIMLEMLLKATVNIKVDCEPGPEYGRQLKTARIDTLSNIIEMEEV